MKNKLLMLFLVSSACWLHADVQELFTLFQYGHYEEACQLIPHERKYAVLNAQDNMENTLLIAAILYADALDATHTPVEKIITLERTIDCILDRIDHDVIFVDRKNTYWQTALIVAAKRGYTEVAQYLYLQGANPRIKDIYGRDARHHAPTDQLYKLITAWEWEYILMQRDAHNVWYLLRNGWFSSVDSHVIGRFSEEQLTTMRDCLGNSFFMAPIVFSCKLLKASCKEKELKIINMLDLVYMAISDQAAWLQLLNAQNYQGQTALMWAVKYNLEGVVLYLLGLGADISLQDALGRKAIDYTEDVTVKQLFKKYTP